MGQVIYSVASSLDGYNTDAQGNFDWAFPEDSLVAALTEDLSGVSTYLYGRRMYETMAIWETDPAAAEESPESANFARIWQEADKVVFSSTLQEPWTRRTRLEPVFTLAALDRARAEASGNLTIEGPTLAGTALALAAVDVVELLIFPVVVGGGTRVFPEGLRLDLSLTRERRFDGGIVQVTYETVRR